MSEQNSDPSFRGFVKKGNSLSDKLLEGVTAGGKKTRSEWAEHFHSTTSKISGAMNKLRKQGHMLFPIGGKNTWPQQEGIITNVSLKVADIRETAERHDKTYLAPQLESAFRLFESAVTHHPEMYDYMEKRLTGTLTKLLVAKENFKPYANRKLVAGKD